MGRILSNTFNNYYQVDKVTKLLNRIIIYDDDVNNMTSRYFNY